MKKIAEIAKLLRYYSLTSTTSAGSGHPTSCLSSADLMAVLFAGNHFRYDVHNPENPSNDRLIFSKGHASPLFYAMWALAGGLAVEELDTLRKIGSRLEGHPTMKFPYTEVPTGSLGQGLGVGVGMAINAKYLDKSSYRTYVLLGDSEMAEGSNYEAMEIASHYKLDNLVAVIDANRLGQRGETMYGHNLEVYEERAKAFGWFPIVIDGHNLEHIDAAFKTTEDIKDMPFMIIAKTFKGKGISFLEDMEGKHGVALKDVDLQKAILELGELDKNINITLPKPASSTTNSKAKSKPSDLVPDYKLQEMVATREAYGKAIEKLAKANESIVVLDAETSNSTFSDTVKKSSPDKFFEMYIAEGNMVSVATGLAKRGNIPFVSTFAAFLTRAFDQIRMSAYGDGNIKIVGSHAGVSIGEDGTSQMGLEDISMMRSVHGSVVLYPSDAVSTEQLVGAMATHKGIAYIRTTRAKTPVIYENTENFEIGGCKVHKISKEKSSILIIGAGITLHEALKAQKMLEQKGVISTVIDLYSIKPIDASTLIEESEGVKKIIVVEDHFEAGGIAEAVRSAIGKGGIQIESLAVTKMPQSGKPEELLRYEEIDAEAIVKSVHGVQKVT